MRRCRTAIPFLLLLLSLASPAGAALLRGEVVRVLDGDTVEVLDGEKRPNRIRLSGIDAPERRQAFSDRARQFLADLVFRKAVEVHWEKRDRYGRIVGRVMVADPACKGDCPKSIDAGLALVEAGYAWWYRDYANEQPSEERKRYEEAERRARAARIGLWSDPKPTPPWEFRRLERKKRR